MQKKHADPTCAGRGGRCFFFVNPKQLPSKPPGASRRLKPAAARRSERTRLAHGARGNDPWAWPLNRRGHWIHWVHATRQPLAATVNSSTERVPLYETGQCLWRESSAISQFFVGSWFYSGRKPKARELTADVLTCSERAPGPKARTRNPRRSAGAGCAQRTATIPTTRVCAVLIPIDSITRCPPLSFLPHDSSSQSQNMSRVKLFSPMTG